MSIKDALNDDLEQIEKIAKGKGESLKPGTYIVNECRIDYGSGVSHQLTAYLQEIHVFEDMDKFGITGWIVLLDSDNLISGYTEKHQIVGQEVIFLKFRNLYSQYPVDCSRHPLQVTKIEALAEKQQGNEKSQHTYTYRIHFCSPEMLLNDRIRVSKTYTNTWSKVVEDILVEQLKTKKRIVLQDTMTQQRMVVPYMHPYDAINSILKKTYASNNMPNYHFYETTKGFKFKSMQGFLGGDDDHQITYTFSPTAMEGSYVFKMKQAINHQVMRLGDTFASINAGMWAGKSIEHDSYHKVYNTATVGYHYDLPIKQTSSAAKYKLYSTEGDVYASSRVYKQWRSPESGSLKADAEVFELDSKSVSDFPNSKFSVSSTGTSNTYNTLDGTRITNNSIVFPEQTHSLLRAMQLEHDNYHTLGLTVHGQSGLQVGDKVGIETMTIGQPHAAAGKEDVVLSDYYYIVKLSHNINLIAQTYSCNLVCAKEGRLIGALPKNGDLSGIAEAQDEVLTVASMIQEKDFEG